ncbi:unnamed protein product [Penicillium camemberti]|uniref:Str. FM013 n=1 Tax=Penicillium camemberti (strain FM 013) TaxID=1429867 RepID=A0A0G4P317_PENC3|nr:unnamed protein product [Penicillium camemberti]
MYEKRDVMAANPYWCYAHQHQLDRELASRHRELKDLKAQAKRDAAKERGIWKQVV